MSLSQLETLAESGLEQEARDVLAALLDAAATVFGPVLARTLEEFEHEIFALGDGARDQDRQKVYFNTVREARRARDELLPRITQLLEHALACNPSQAAPPAHAVEGRLAPAEAKMLGEMATAARPKVECPLAPLAQRYAQVIGASVAGTPRASRSGGPAARGYCARVRPEFTQQARGTGCCSYRVLDRHWLTALADFYRLGQSRGSWPRSRTPPRRASRPPRRKKPPPERRVPPCACSACAADASDSTRRRGRNPAPAAASSASESTPRAAPPHCAPAEATRLGRTAPGALPARRAAGPLGSFRSAHRLAADRPRRHEQAPREHGDTELRDQYFRARDLLIQRLQSARNDAPPSSGAQSQSVARTEDVQLVLSVMNLGTGPAVPGPHALSRSLVQLKQDLVNQLRQFTPDGKPPRLSDADSTTFDLVGRIVRRAGPGHPCRRQRADAAARRCACRSCAWRWPTSASSPRPALRACPGRGRARADPVLARERAGRRDRDGASRGHRRAHDRIQGQQPSCSTRYFGEYRAHQEMAARKSELLEKRQVEAAAGRERLQIARREAESAVAQSMANGDPPPLVRQLLEQDWARLLALTNLAKGRPASAIATAWPWPGA
jgi:hypothetical protein